MMDTTVPESRAERFYVTVLERLMESGVPFLVGGAYAMREYAGIFRWTKDLDVFCKRQDVERILELLSDSGCWIEVTDPVWLAKGVYRDLQIDVIFNSGNGLNPVDDAWFAPAPSANVLGCIVGLVPPEDMIISKAHVQERERYDGADIHHIIRKHGLELDWERLLQRIGHWEVLLAHLVNFRFVYPSDRERVPRWVMEALLARARAELETSPPVERICRGPVLSRTQYQVALAEWGYLDSRLLASRGDHGRQELPGARRRARRPARA